MLPFGGYVKFFGDAGASSDANRDLLSTMTPEEKRVSFHHQPVHNRMAIVAAGPLANFVLSILILTLVFIAVGRPFTPPVIGTILEDSAAAEAGFEVGDRVVGIDGRAIDRFEDIREIVMFAPEQTLQFQVKRDGAVESLTVTPRATEVTDRLGNVHRIGLLGIGVGAREYAKLGPASALLSAGEETFMLVKRTLEGIGEIIVGVRSAREIGGPIMIAQMSGVRASDGFIPLLEFVVVLSASLGLINLFPIPVLDGGHLVFYAFEAVRGRPLGEKAQELGTVAGLTVVMMLMVFVTFNDLTRPAVIEFFTNLVG
jgi:regulator of sigma E protease